MIGSNSLSCNPVSLALTAASYAAGGAVTGAVGARILHIAGHAGYDVLQATQHGAIGGAIVGAPAELLLGLLAPPHPTTQQRDLRWSIAGGAALTAAEGALGAAVLHSARPDLAYMTRGASAAACATGTAAGLVFALWLGAVSFVVISRQASANHSSMEMA